MTQSLTRPSFRPVPKPAQGTHKAQKAKRKTDLERHRVMVKEWVIMADRGNCQIQAEDTCWGQGSTAHHVFGRGRSPDDDCEQPDALLLVCHPCHVAIHRAPGNYERITQERVEECLEEAIKQRPEFAG